MDWIVNNIFQLIGIAGSVGSLVLVATKVYWSIESRVAVLERDYKKLDERLDKDLHDVHEILTELRNDIKLLLGRGH